MESGCAQQRPAQVQEATGTEWSPAAAPEEEVLCWGGVGAGTGSRQGWGLLLGSLTPPGGCGMDGVQQPQPQPLWHPLFRLQHIQTQAAAAGGGGRGGGGGEQP